MSSSHQNTSAIFLATTLTQSIRGELQVPSEIWFDVASWMTPKNSVPTDQGNKEKQGGKFTNFSSQKNWGKQGLQPQSGVQNLEEISFAGQF